MSVRKFMPENRLAKALEDPNGLLFRHALEKAGANLESVRDSHVAMLDVKVQQLAALAAGSARRPEDAAELYRIAREIRADAGMFKLADVSRAAHSLCELMASERPGEYVWGGAVVHAQAITALRQPLKGSRQSRENMLQGLERISGTT